MIKGKTAPREMSVSQGIPIIKVRNVTNEGVIWKTDYILRNFFEANIESHLRKSDILVTSTGVGTIGRVAILGENVECMTDGHVTALRVLDEAKISPNYLAHYLRSTFGQMQMEQFTVGCTGQTELNDSDIALIKILYPEAISEQMKILESAQKYEKIALESKSAYRSNLDKAKGEFMKALTS